MGSSHSIDEALEFYNDVDAWLGCHPADRWVYNKLELSCRMGYQCGPACVPVPQPGEYIVRPTTNLHGMGLGAYFSKITWSTDHLPVGTFWCEVFEGRHLSVDYDMGKQVLCVEGHRTPGQPISRFSKWECVTDVMPFPEILHQLKGDYRHINVEYINGRLIEVHLRDNPDFRDGAAVIYPVWRDDKEASDKIRNPNYVPAAAADRLGFIKL